MTEETLLYRQVHPSFLDGERPTSQVFTPTSKDQKRLSVYDGDKVSAAEAWEHYTKVLGHKSVGILAVQVRECSNLGLRTEEDPLPNFPAHAVVIFPEAWSIGKVKTVAKSLTSLALERGWQYGPYFGST